MAIKRIKRPRDPVQLAKLLGDILTGQIEDKVDDGKNAAAASLGQMGGKARSKSLSSSRRKEIAKKAAATRWKNKE